MRTMHQRLACLVSNDQHPSDSHDVCCSFFPLSGPSRFYKTCASRESSKEMIIVYCMEAKNQL